MSDFNDSSISDSVTDEAFEQSLGDAPQDVLEAADQPAPSGESVEDAPEADPEVVPEADEAPKGDEKPAEELPKIEDGQEPEEFPSFKDAPDAWSSLREKYETNRKELIEAKSNSLKEKFFTDAEGFLDELNGLSTSQFQQTQQQIVKRGIDAMPDEFAQYMAEVAPEAVIKTLAGMSPDTLAETLFGKGVSAQKAQKILAQVKAQDLEEYLNDNDSDDVKAQFQPKTTAEAVKAMSPDEIDNLVSKKVAEAGRPGLVDALEQRTYAEIMKPVNALFSEAGLMPLETDTPSEKEYKEWAVASIGRETLDHLMYDEKNKPRATKMLEFISNLDESGVKHLASTAAILAEEYAGRRIQMLTGERAKVRAKGTEPKKPPPPVIPSSGTLSAFGNPAQNGAGRISDISESDFENAGM